MSLTTALTSSQLGKLSKVCSKRTILKSAFILYALALVIFPLVPTIWALLLPTTIFGIAHGVNIPSIQTILAELTPMEHRAAVMSVNGMALRLGQTLGPLLMGIIFVLWGMASVFYAGAGFSIAAFILVVAMIE
jgi:predicted MFS family arabinose efflux permease